MMNSVLPDVPADNRSPGLAAPSDAQLLSAFVQSKDEAAFETLVRRHGPMVFGVARRLLGNEHDAADVFQAVFLVLARKAASIRAGNVLGAWLYNVAYRTSIRARTARQKRTSREGTVSVMPEPAVECEPVDDVLKLLDEELRALPAKYQTPVVLCDLQGQSRKAAAELLNVPEGTISSRLATGRKKLADRLRRRGVAVTAVTLATILAQNAASAGVPAPLVAVTVKAALPSAAGQTVAGLVSTNAVNLSQGVLQSMLIAKLQLLFLAIVTPFLVGAALLGFVAQEPAPDDEAAALATLKKLGAKLRWEATPAGKQLVGIDLHAKKVQDRHVKLLGFFKELRDLSLNETLVTDAGGAGLADFPKLQTLRLNRTGISDASLKAFAGLSNLKVLSIGWTKITAAGVKDLAPLTELRDLDLRNTEVGDEGLKNLVPFRKLEALELSKTNITDAGLKDLAGLERLRILRVENNPGVTDAGIKDIALHAPLESLSLENNPGVSDAGVNDLAPLAQLVSLNLSGTKVTDAGLAELARFKRLAWLAIDRTAVTGVGFEKTTGFKQLGALWLSGTKLTDEKVKHVAALRSITELRIQKTAVTDAGVKELAPLRQLANLSLDDTKITDACFRDLAVFPRLWLLNLSGTKVGDAGLKELADLAREATARTRAMGAQKRTEPPEAVGPFNPAALGGRASAATQTGFQPLRWLGLHNTAVTDAGLKHLAALPQLGTLWISWTKVSDAGLKDIAKLSNLDTLRLGGCKVTDAGLKDLAPLTNLRNLWLDWTQITDAGLKELAVFKRIEELRLDGTAVTDAGLQELAALKQLQRIELQKTAVSDAAIAKLQSKLNNVTINTKAADEPAATTESSERGRAFWWLLGAVGVMAGASLFGLLFVKRKRILTPALICVSFAAMAVIGYRVMQSLRAQPPAVAKSDGKVRLLKGHKSPVHDLRFTPDGKRLISASGWPSGPAQDYSIRIWDLATDQELMRIQAPGQIGAIDLSADGRFLLVGGIGGLMYVDVETGEILQSMRRHRGPIAWVSLAADGKHAYSASHDGTARKWNLNDGTEVKQFRVAGKWARFVAELPDGRLLTADTSSVLQFWDMDTGQEVQRIQGNVRWLTSAVLAPGGKQVIIAGWNAFVWDLATGKMLHSFEEHRGDVPRMVFSADGKKLLTCSFDGTVKLWDYESATLLHEVSSQPEFIFTAVFSPDGRTIAHAGGGRKLGDKFLSGEDHDIRILDVSALMEEPVAAGEADGVSLWSIGLAGAVAALAVLAGIVLWRRRAASPNAALRKDSVPEAGIVTFPCPQCGKNLKAKNELAGKKVKCPRCAAVTFVPSMQTSPPAL